MNSNCITGFPKLGTWDPSLRNAAVTQQNVEQIKGYEYFVKAVYVIETYSRPGVFNCPTRSGAWWFSVLPDDELHPPGVPGLNQSLITG